MVEVFVLDGWCFDFECGFVDDLCFVVEVIVYVDQVVCIFGVGKDQVEVCVFDFIVDCEDVCIDLEVVI